MSNIEPTEAHRRAATGIVLACLSGANNVASVFVVARLLAESEAKLRAELKTERLVAEKALVARNDMENERDAARRDLARANDELARANDERVRANDERVRASGYLLAAQKSEMARKGKLADARARVAELETSVKQKAAHIEEMEANANRVGAAIKIFMDYEDASQRREATYLARIAELEAERFAAVSSDGFLATGTGPVHVDDVKALVDALFAPNGSGIVHTEGAKAVRDFSVRQAEADVVWGRIERVVDAKADAPASTEGEEG